MHKTLADIDNWVEQELVVRKKARAVQSQELWDIEVDGRTQGLRLND